METSISFDTVFKHKQSPQDSGCFASSENVQKKAVENPCNGAPGKKTNSDVIKFESAVNPSEGVDSFIVSCMNNLDVTVSRSADNEQSSSNDLMNVNVTWPKLEADGIQHHSQVIDSSSADTANTSSSSKDECSSKFTVPGTDISECTTSSKNVITPKVSVTNTTKSKQKIPPPIPIRSCIPANIDQLKCSKGSSIVDNIAVAAQELGESIPPIDHQLWHEAESSTSANRCSSQVQNCRSKGNSSSKGKKSHGLELNLSKKSSNSKGFFSHNRSADGGNKSSSSNDMCNQALMNQVVHKLNAEGINLSVLPYTDKVSNWNAF